MINTESRAREANGSTSHFQLNNARMWVMGYKCEIVRTNFEILNGSELEVLGGMAQQTMDPSFRKDFSKQPELPLIRSVDSRFSYMGAANSPGTRARYKTVVEEVRDGVTRTVEYKNPAFPERLGESHTGTVQKDLKTFPLLIGY